jgi:hypothetical protein
MTHAAPVIRIEPEGPAGTGLVEWERIDPATLVSGEPVQRGHVYDEDAEAGYLAGVWECTAYTEPMAPYPVDEFMLVLGGEVVMILPGGERIPVRPGEAFVIPKGLECQWSVPDHVRKVFMILDGAGPGAGETAALGRITLPRLGPIAAEGAAVSVERTDFLNSDGRMSVSVLDCAAASLPPRRWPGSELLHVLAGDLTLATEAGAERFAPGETACLPRGTRAGWTVAAGTRLLRARFEAGG